MYGRLTSRTDRSRARTARRSLVLGLNFDALEARTLLSLAIIKDVNTVDSSPANITLDNGKIFYTTHDPAGGFDLQVTTTAGATTLLKSFSTPGPYGGSGITNLTAVGAKLFFSATSADGTELWSTDGTAANTTEVKDIAPGTKSSNPSLLTSFNGQVFFTADATGGTAPILWVSDGTSAGTTPLKDSGNNPIANVTQIAVAGPTLFISVSGGKLFQSDGTTPNTTLLKQFNGGVAERLTPVGSTLFLAANDGATGNELWDVVNGNVTLVKDIRAGAFGSYPSNLTSAGGKLFFEANDGTNGGELWVSDGTAANTKLVKDIFAGAQGSYPSNLTAVGGTLFYSASDGSGSSTSGQELWKTDSTTLTTIRLKDINPASGTYGASIFRASGGLLYFSNDDDTDGVELWKSDGTGTGTVLVADVNPGAASSFPSDLLDVNGTLYFSAHDNTGGNQLWKTTGTVATTIKVQTFKPAATQDAIAPFFGNVPQTAPLGSNAMVFVANDGQLGTELFETDGTAAGTTLLKDITPGQNGSYFQYLTPVGSSQVFFVVDNFNGPAQGAQLWVTNGTPAGTTMVTSFPQTFTISNLTALGSQLLFTAIDTAHGKELWVTDGTPLNTKVIDIRPGATGSDPSGLTAFNGKLYFSATDGTKGQELWQSDGTAAGTTLVKDIKTGNSGSYPTNLTVFGNSLFFTANDGNSPNEIWVSDGSPGGTTLFTTLTKTATESIGNLTVSGNSLFFTANDTSLNGALWLTNGTAAGTVVVSDVAPQGFNSPFFASPRQTLISLNNGSVVFVANDGSTGREPWVSNGTSQGTMLLRDINSTAEEIIAFPSVPQYSEDS